MPLQHGCDLWQRCLCGALPSRNQCRWVAEVCEVLHRHLWPHYEVGLLELPLLEQLARQGIGQQRGRDRAPGSLVRVALGDVDPTT